VKTGVINIGKTVASDQTRDPDDSFEVETQRGDTPIGEWPAPGSLVIFLVLPVDVKEEGFMRLGRDGAWFHLDQY
jgi:hypothetical protein